MKRILVIGAAGDVGRGVVKAALDKGWFVAASGRSKARLETMAEEFEEPESLLLLSGDIGTEETAGLLQAKVAEALSKLDAVVVAVNAPNTAKSMLQWTVADLSEVIQGNLTSHFIAAKTFIPMLDAGGVYIAIGGGTADFVLSGMGHLSMCQAAQRMMIRAIAKEHRNAATHIRELIIISMVNGAKKRDIADPGWLTEIEIGEHVVAVTCNPDQFPGPILTIKTRDQVGQPTRAHTGP